MDEYIGMKIRAEALYSDETEHYRTPCEPKSGDTVKVRFRAGIGDADAVFMVLESGKIPMKKIESRGCFDYYEASVLLGEETIHYYFEIYGRSQRICYNQRGAIREPQDRYSFGIVPGFSTPEWAKGAVMYQIYVDRFCNGDPSNDVLDREYFYIGEYVEGVKDWNAGMKQRDIARFYGGDLQGVLDKLDYLQELGVQVLYLNPIFVSPSNHKYDCQDYDYIDPHFGVIVKDEGEVLRDGDSDNSHATRYISRVTDKENLEASNAFFAKFVEEVHKRGMKVILDGVFNHCGSFNKWMDRECIYENQEGYAKGAYVAADSPYRSFFGFKNQNSYDWPYNESYEGWWGHDTLPKLNYEESDALKEYILHVARKWVSAPYHVDGWRLDVAADLGHTNAFNHGFWKEFRKAVKEANPEAVIYAEHYGEATSWLQGDEWDSVMNYDAFMEPVTWFLTGMEKHSDSYRGDLLGNDEAFVGSMLYHMANFYGPSLQIAMNQLSNHDHSRFLTRTNGVVGRLGKCSAKDAERNVSKAVLKEAVVMQMTWMGAPTLYYGDEAGVCGFTDPDNRRTYPWGHEDQDLLEFHKAMIRIRKEHPVLACGSTCFLKTEHQVLTYGRFDKEEQLVVAVNNDQTARTVEVPVWRAEVPEEAGLERLILTSEDGFDLETERYLVKKGVTVLTLPPRSAMVLKACEQIREK